MKIAILSPVPLLLTGTAALAQAPLYDLSSVVANAQHGTSLAALGDVDGDGFGDIAVGAARGAGMQPESGHVVVYSMRTGAALYTIPGERTGDMFGWSVAGLGDLDNDGIGDLIVGAPLTEPLVGTDRGAMYIRSGVDGSFIHKVGGSNDVDRAGWAVAGPGDVNLDGVPDYAFSEPWDDSGATDRGIVWVLSGADNSLLRFYRGAAAGDQFGFALDAAGDVNADGRGDLVIGAPLRDVVNFIDAGQGYVATGAASDVFLFTKPGSVALGWFGYDVAGVPDADGNGFGEVAFGEPFFTGGGRVRVYSGSTQALVRDFVGANDERLGISVAGLADASGDGLGDILIGSTAADIGALSDAGAASAYTVASGALITSMAGYHSNEGFGRAVASAGDLNADGFTDLMAGSPFFDGHAPDAGRVRTVLGNAPAPNGYCAPKVNSLGCVPQISYTGCPSASISNYFEVIGVNVLQGVAGILIWSQSSQAAPFGGGTLCVAAPIKRTPIQISSPYPASPPPPCTGLYRFNFDHAHMQAHNLTAGDDVYAQYWSRDNGFAAPDNIGLTGGLHFSILP